MKRLIAIMTAVCLALSLGGALGETEGTATLAPFDPSFFTENGEAFQVMTSEDGTQGFVETRNPVQSRAFSTPYDSGEYYSVIFPDMLLMNYDLPGEIRPVFRIWIRYRGTEHLKVTSVSFIGEGTEYRFSDVTLPEWSDTKEDGTAAEDLLITAGSEINNARFFAELMAAGYEYGAAKYAGETQKDTSLPAWKLVLHGDREVETELPEGFWEDLTMFTLALYQMNAFSYLGGTPGTLCQVISPAQPYTGEAGK